MKNQAKPTESKNQTKIHKVTLFFNPSNIILKKHVACTSFALQKRKLLNDAIHKVSVTTFIWIKKMQNADCGRLFTVNW